MIKRIESGISAKSLEIDYLFNVRDYANSLDINGVVYTKNDGSVKIIAEGEEENLKEFIEKVKENNLLHPIENFYVLWEEPLGKFKDFSILDEKK